MDEFNTINDQIELAISYLRSMSKYYMAKDSFLIDDLNEVNESITELERW